MKKHLLFVIDTLLCGGSEKSLLSLLSVLDYSKYEVDLQLFYRGGELEALLPSQVNILPLPLFCEYELRPLFSREALKHPLFALDRIKKAVISKLFRDKIHGSQLYWRSCKGVIPAASKAYDAAIAYSQGIPTGYVAQKVSASKKLAWVNLNYKNHGYKKEWDLPHYNQFNSIVCVSDLNKQAFLEVFPQFEDKISRIDDMVNPEIVLKMAELEPAPFAKDSDLVNIVTVGRLRDYKGYDIAAEACKILIDRGFKLRWYVIGEGQQRAEIQRDIVAKQLESSFMLLGSLANPYPHLKAADIYVQTSKTEGYGIAIAEARLLNLPIVSTDFEAVHYQLRDGENGLIGRMDGESIADCIQLLITQPQLAQQMILALKAEKKGNVEEIEKFYRLI
ncbi:MAG: glycosyltransferase [Oscillospiraceae bacterium]|nr:glycosyltransferase [Oscillospiraceae bacterium]